MRTALAAAPEPLPINPSHTNTMSTSSSYAQYYTQSSTVSCTALRPTLLLLLMCVCDRTPLCVALRSCVCCEKCDAVRVSAEVQYCTDVNKCYANCISSGLYVRSRRTTTSTCEDNKTPSTTTAATAIAAAAASVYKHARWVPMS
eukprot:1937-Heterococcus_DN1.PRE.3